MEKEFSHIMLTDKGLIALNAPEKPMIPYKNSKWYKETGGYKEPDLWFSEKLQQAVKEGVYFKNQESVIKTMYLIDGFGLNKRYPELNKPYSVPDGYEVKIEGGYVNPEWNEEYAAILVSKEKTKDEIDREFIDMVFPRSIEEAAYKELGMVSISDKNKVAHSFIEGYIAGAKSEAAKEYWFQLFKQDNNGK